MLKQVVHVLVVISAVQKIHIRNYDKRVGFCEMFNLNTGRS